MELAECAQRSLCGMEVELRSAAMELAECAERSHCGLGVELRSAAMERSRAEPLWLRSRTAERSHGAQRRGASTLRNCDYGRTLPRIIAAGDSND
jgi:hypothetical protein